MNSFAQILFNILLGWMRALVQTVWNAVTQGSAQGFLKWLGDRWAVLALAMICIGCALDIIIWLLRWQPYRLWRARLTRLLHRREEREFDRGYAEAVAPLAEDARLFEDDGQSRSMPPPDEAEYEFDAMPEYAQPQSTPREPQTDGASAFAFRPAYTRADLYAASRRRRSARHKTSRFDTVRRSLLMDEDENSMIDGLPPPVSKQEAFHQPVYPGDTPKLSWAKSPRDERKDPPS